MGGPAIKNRLFWFTDYQGTRETRGVSSGLVTLPSAAQRSGVFTPAHFSDPEGNPMVVNGSYWASVLSKRLGYNVQRERAIQPAELRQHGDLRFPGRSYSAARILAPARGTLKFIPLPNAGVNQFVTSGQNRKVIDDKAGQRVDILTQRTGNWFVYYIFDDATVTNPLRRIECSGISDSHAVARAAGSSEQYEGFRTTAVNDARLTFTRSAVITDQPTAGFGKVRDFGFVTGLGTLGIIPSGPPGYEALPPLSFINFSIGSPTLTTFQPNNTWHFSDGFSKIWPASHVEIRRRVPLLPGQRAQRLRTERQFQFRWLGDGQRHCRLSDRSAQRLHAMQLSSAGFPIALRRRVRAGFVPDASEPHPQLRPALGRQSALVRHAGQDRDDRARAAVDTIPDRAEGLGGPGRSRDSAWTRADAVE